MPGGRRPRAPNVRAWAAAWVSLVILWFLLAGIPTPSEVAAAAIAAGIGATTIVLARRQGLASFRPRARWLLASRRLPAMVLSDFLDLARVLAARGAGHPHRGNIRTVRTRIGGNDARSSARRALVIA